MTLKDIAKEAGVSVSTVSRVVNQNNPKAASAEVQKKIWEAVRKSGYTPNTAARTLKTGKSIEDGASEQKSIACIFARTQDTMGDPFFSQIAHYVEQEAFKSNYFVKYSFSALDIANKRTFQIISDLQADGVVILGRYNEDLLDFLHKHCHNVVYTGLNPIDSDKYDQVICDGYDAAGTAIDYLYKLGHRKIGYIGEHKKEIRFSSYRNSIDRLGLSFSENNTADVKLSAEGGFNGAMELIRRKADITAVFCANDITAIGAIKAFEDTGLRIPKDVSIISIDNIDTAQYVSPMLTTIHIPIEELGRIAAQTLIGRIRREHRLPMKIILPFYIVKRESCRSITPPRL